MQVIGVNKEIRSTDSFLALPVSALGTSYYAITYHTHVNGSRPAISNLLMIAGIHDVTRVTIRLGNDPGIKVTFSGKTYSANEDFAFNLNRFQVIQIGTDRGDLTGTFVKSNKPVAAFSGNRQTFIQSTQSSNRDHLVEQLVPVADWGTTFCLLPTPGNSRDFYRMVASQEKTHISINRTVGTESVEFEEELIVRSGDFIEKQYAPGVYAFITSDKPVIVMKFGISQVPGQRTDPYMATIPATTQYISQYSVTTPLTSLGGTFDNYFQFIVKDADKAGLRVDGIAFPSNVTYHGIPGTDFKGGFISLSHGIHMISHLSSSVTFGGLIYGGSDRESYGTAAGIGLPIIDSPTTTTALTPTMTVDKTTPISSTATDSTTPTSTAPMKSKATKETTRPIPSTIETETTSSKAATTPTSRTK